MTINGAAQLVAKLWNYCNVLRDDGMSYGDYVEQLTYLLFLKMDEERSTGGAIRGGLSRPDPAGISLGQPRALDGVELETHYRELLPNSASAAA